MEPLNQNGKPQNEPQRSVRTSTAANAEPPRLNDVRAALRQTADVFGHGPGGSASASDLLNDPFAPELAPAQPAADRKPRLSYAAKAARDGKLADVDRASSSRLKWAIALLVVSLTATAAMSYWLLNGRSGDTASRQTTLLLLSDSLMASGNYDAAEASLTEAMELQPGSPYVEQRLSRLEQLRSSQAVAPVEQFSRLVAQGDSLYSMLATIGPDDPILAAEINTAAREAYVRALVYRPDDENVREKLRLLAQGDSPLAGENASGASSVAEDGRIRLQQQQLDLYRRAVADGDDLMASGNYLEAQLRFREALIYQPNDTYAVQRLEMINTLWTDTSRNERYTAYLRRGDELLEARLFEQARTAYREALAVQANDPTVLSRMAEVTRLEQEAQRQVNERAAQQQRLQFRTEGDVLMNTGQYEAAFNHYSSALQSFSGDTYFQEQANRARAMLIRQDQVDENGVYRYVTEAQRPRLITDMADLYNAVRYPESAIRDGLDGRVFVQFTVDEQGRVQNPSIVRGLSSDIDREVLRVVRSARYQPAQVDGRAVKVYETLLFTFVLQAAE
jgi:TonB family protein